MPAANNPRVVQSRLCSGMLLTCSWLIVWPIDASLCCSNGVAAVDGDLLTNSSQRKLTSIVRLSWMCA